MKKLRLKSQPKVEIQNTGIWKIDGNLGKAMCLLIMEHEQLTVALVSVPTHDFCREYHELELPLRYASEKLLFCKNGGFTYNLEDRNYYYKIAGKTRIMIHRFPKGFESMANRKLFEKTPSEKRKP